MTRLKQLSKNDLQILQSALIDLHSDISQETLPKRTLRFTEKIIPADVISFDIFDEKGIFAGKRWGTSVIPAEKVEVFMRYAHENPLVTEIVVLKRFDPIILTDLIPTEQFLQTSIYKEFYSIIDVKFQMGITLWVSSDLVVTCAFLNSKQNFSERDRLMLQIAAPHLINAFRNTSDFEHLASALEIKNSGVLAIDGGGGIQYMSEFVRKIWNKYFTEEVKDGDLLPENIRDWVINTESSETKGFTQIPSFHLKNANGELNARFITKNQMFGKTLLLEEKRTITAETLEALHLTKRESEILFWISQGKTDKDIAELCRISPLTVHKHAQHIYIKLGVETRTAAMLRALEVL